MIAETSPSSATEVSAATATTPTTMPATTTPMDPMVAEALEFTATYQRYRHEHKAIREAMCLRVQYPAILGDIRPGDLFAGRKGEPNIVYVGTMRWTYVPRECACDGEWHESKQGGYAYNFRAPELYGTTPEEKQLLTDMTAFWEGEVALTKARARWDEEMNTCMAGSVGQIGGGATGFCLAMDLDRLVQRGIPGLIADIEARQARAEKNGQDTAFFRGLRIAMDVLIDVCRHYEKQARAMAAAATGAADRERLEAMAETLALLPAQAPRSLREALQLIWIYLLLSSWEHPESFRLDGALGDIYVHDVDSGVLTEDEAVELIVGFWDIVHRTGAAALCRMTIGGLGRRNVENADRFALAAMEATRRHRQVTPQLTLRNYKGQDPRLLAKAFEVIAATGVYPMLYNDDVVVPGVAQALRVSPEAAQDYYPLGCGEYMIGAATPSLLMSGWNVGKTLEAVLHNGRTCEGERIGIETGTLDQFDTYEKLYDAVCRQIAFAASLVARTYQHALEELPSHCAFLYGSLLTNDCLERGLPILDRGARYTGACVMGHGYSNAADALTAIRQLVFAEKRLTLQEIVAALDANFEGHEGVRRMLLDAPKFGNDHDEADRTLVELWREISRATQEEGLAIGLDFLAVSSVNPGGYQMGEACGATADGRKRGEPFAIGHAPTAGNDRRGITALCNSVVKADAANGGATTSMKLSPQLFAGARPPVAALIEAYFAQGGQQASLTVVSRNDLEAAMREPEKHTHIMVRIGGWCARFVEQEPAVQQEILRRTQY